VTGSYDDTARLWRLGAAGLEGAPRVLMKHAGACLTVAVSHDGRRLLTGSDRRGDARLFNVVAGEPEAFPLTLREAEVGGAGFSIDGRWLFTGSHATRSVALWPLDLRELMALGCRTAGRTLTRAEWEQYFRLLPFAPFCTRPE
jgi:WD40 repeat protein